MAINICTNRNFLIANDVKQYVFKWPNLFPFKGRRGRYTIFWNLVFWMCFIWFHYVFIKFPVVIILSQMCSSNFQKAPNSFTFYLQTFILNYTFITYIKRKKKTIIYLFGECPKFDLMYYLMGWSKNKITKIKVLGLWGPKN
jgi:hypothetical protein